MTTIHRGTHANVISISVSFRFFSEFVSTSVFGRVTSTAYFQREIEIYIRYYYRINNTAERVLKKKSDALVRHSCVI